MRKLEEAILLAVKAHAGQEDKVGAPYILHPLRIMCRLDTDEARMAAVLHDVVEDTSTTLDELRSMGFPDEVLRAVECLTKREGESYEEFIDRVLVDPIAIQVKIADLEDNMDVRRLPDVTEKDRVRLARYVQAWGRLKGAVRERFSAGFRA